MRTEQHNIRIGIALKGKKKSAIHRLKVKTARKGQSFGVKICECCKKEYDSKGPLQRICRECAPTMRYRHIFFRYGVSKEQYGTMMATNNGMCWICLKRKATCVDHNHKTNQVRGLLCKFCNVAISIIDDKQALERVNAYLSADVYKEVS